MSDRKDSKRDEQGTSGRKGFGDDQGTRVGSPTPGSQRDETRGPSHVADGMRTSSTSGESDESDTETGMGAEAAEGLHTTKDRKPGQRSALENVDAGRDRFDEATVERAGSEPIRREREHESGYGGKGGAPKTSSDRREPLEPEGHADER